MFCPGHADRVLCNDTYRTHHKRNCNDTLSQFLTPSCRNNILSLSSSSNEIRMLMLSYSVGDNHFQAIHTLRDFVFRNGQLYLLKTK